MSTGYQIDDQYGMYFFKDRSSYHIGRFRQSGDWQPGRRSCKLRRAGIAGYNGDGGLADTSEVNPIALTKDHFGNLFIADVHNNSIRKVDIGGFIHTEVGTGIAGYSGDNGVATAAELHSPEGIAFDVCGNLYISDEANHRIRKVTYPPILTTPAISITGPTSEPIGNAVTVNATISNAGSSYLIHWTNRGIEFTTTTVPSVTYTKAAGTDTITARVVSTATYGCYDSTTSAPVIVSVESEALPSLSEGAGLSVYPNPVKDVVYIDIGAVLIAIGRGSEQRYEIMSIEGRVMLEGVLHEGRNNIPVQQLPAGMYMVVVTGSDGMRVIKKVIKQ